MNFIKSNKGKLFFVFFVIAILFGFIYSNSDVLAATTVKVDLGDPKVRVCFNRSTGAYVSSYENNSSDCGSGNGRDTIKYIGSEYAYCVNWGLLYYSGDYTEVSSWSKSSKNAIMAGYLINRVNSKGTPKEYARTGATLNTFFATVMSDSGSYNYSKDEDIKGYISSAQSYYNSVKLSTSLPAISLSTSSNSLSYNDTNKKYFSGKITLSGLYATYGGDSDKVTYNVTATASNDTTVNICTNSKGTGCQTSVTLSNQSSNYSFYLFADANKITKDDTITVKVTGSNNSTYYSSILYKNTGHDDSQKLIVKDEYQVSRKVSKSITFVVPDTVNHRIYGYKVDENGDNLNGATLEIYKDDPDKSSNLLATNNGKGSTVTYSTGTVAEGEDDFFKHDYYLVEKSAPDGFIFSPVNHFYLKNSAKNGVSCYYNGGSEEEEAKLVDSEFCYPEHYQYMCQKEDGTIVDLIDENCQYEITVEPDPDPSQGGEDETTPDGNDTTDENGENDTTGDGNENNEITDEETTVIVNYDKVCYKSSDSKVVDEAYCNSKESYTKVYNYNGNISITQVNSRNVVRISKTDITGEKEVSGASLKICTKASYDSKKDECEPAKTVDNIEMVWTSGEEAYAIYGVPKGSYYIVEVTPPRGYIQATIATQFSIDESGEVKTGNKVITNKEFVEKTGAIVVKNELSKITISKQDMATSGELPGAKLSICRTYTDLNNEVQVLVDQYTGDCIEAVLVDGTKASWISTNEPRIIEGLSAGTYYLVETSAPDGFTTTESILFTLKSNGSLADANGKSLDNNKLVMKDAPITEVETGSLSIYVVGGILVVVVILGIGSYCYLRKPKVEVHNNNSNNKIRKRKIHKM